MSEENTPQEPAFIFNKPDIDGIPPVALMTITKEQGTVNIKFDHEYMEALIQGNPMSRKAWAEIMAAQGPMSQGRMTMLLVELCSGTINSFHHHAYAVANQSHPGILGDNNG